MTEHEFYRHAFYAYLGWGYAEGVPGGVFNEGFCVWLFTQGRWVLQKQTCVPGYECGLPPHEKGQYEGELRRTRCKPMPKTS